MSSIRRGQEVLALAIKSSHRHRLPVSSTDIDEYEIPAYGLSFGVASLGLQPSFVDVGVEARSGVMGYVSGELSPTALLFDDASTHSRGISVYDRASLSLAALNVSGEEVNALRLDYMLVVGYRALLLGFFAGAMVGTGSVAFDDTLRSAGAFVPLAARLELPWFFESRLSANAWGVKIAGKRAAAGVDLRMPILSSSAWFAFGYESFSGESDQSTARNLTAILGFGL